MRGVSSFNFQWVSVSMEMLFSAVNRLHTIFAYYSPILAKYSLENEKTAFLRPSSTLWEGCACRAGFLPGKRSKIQTACRRLPWREGCEERACHSAAFHVWKLASVPPAQCPPLPDKTNAPSARDTPSQGISTSPAAGFCATNASSELTKSV